MHISRWVLFGAVGVLVLLALEWTKPDDTPPPLTTRDAFFDAAGAGDIATLRTMLENGTDVNAKDETFGQTALIIASRMGRSEVVELLLAKGADSNVADNYGQTALHWARKKNFREVIKMLQQAGAVEPAREAWLQYPPSIG